MSYTKTNVADLEDKAPGYGMAEYGSARFAREALGAERIGMAHYAVNPGQRIGFGHSHEADEEIYVVVAGSGRMKLGDEVVELAAKDVVYCPPATMRAWEAGPDGLELLAFGSHTDGDGDMTMGWWTD